ncbi:two-component regulator propeller domain-containing protein [Hymenobacter sp. APR13]|uniref:two-component regulator propeller domain-containing protein n=1 Tax=Hymenobacter sp. APR13 TaxID=1356852 RepID=UPI0012E07BED|nr:two-component regulator propeller domain-containing protein [Hymenobacter sp. APR13]
MKTQLLNSIIHRQRLLFSIRFLISISMAIVMLVVQPVRADSNAKVALSTILNSDGTIRVGACGSFDTYGYTLVNTSNGQPAFQPTLNTQQVLGAQGSGDEHWSGPSGMTGTNGNVFALALDSNGNLYIGGSFTMAGSILANNIAKWDGINWTALGVGIRGKVVALSVSSNGTVYAGGYFTTAGGVVANNVAKWDGTSWTGLGSGINGNPILNRCIKSLALDGNDNLYAGGDFTTAGGISANNIAKWNGTTWTALGAGLTGTSIACVDAVAIDNNGILYAGGGFYLTGGTSVNSIAKWEGTAWTSLGTGISGNVYALATDGSGNVYVGGSFDIAGGIPAKNIAKWNGTTWTALGTGINGTSPFNKSVWALTVDVNNNVYAGGGFNTAGGIAVNNIAKWNGTSWAALGTGVNDSPNTVNSTISALIAGTALYAGGSFGTAGGAVVNAVARWEPNASRWSRLGPEGQSVNGDIYTMAVDNSGNLYVGGNFTTAGNIVANNIAKWNGTSWTALGSGILEVV